MIKKFRMIGYVLAKLLTCINKTRNIMYIIVIKYSLIKQQQFPQKTDKKKNTTSNTQQNIDYFIKIEVQKLVLSFLIIIFFKMTIVRKGCLILSINLLQYLMATIITLYLTLQILAAYFLYNQLANHLDKYTYHLIWTFLAILFYLATCLRSPGSSKSEQNNKVNQSENNSIVNTTQALPISIFFITTKSCRYCEQEQLTRMKHCRECGVCIATFDHHCLWMENCIGQKNRPLFYLCLCFNFLESFYAQIALIKTMYIDGSFHTYQIVFLSMVGIVSIGVLGLLCVHSYLMLKNLTTWQVTCWKKIHYLSEFTHIRRSPFSRGFIGNLQDYWGNFYSKSPKIWKFNTVSNQFILDKGLKSLNDII